MASTHRSSSRPLLIALVVMVSSVLGVGAPRPASAAPGEWVTLGDVTITESDNKAWNNVTLPLAWNTYSSLGVTLQLTLGAGAGGKDIKLNTTSLSLAAGRGLGTVQLGVFGDLLREGTESGSVQMTYTRQQISGDAVGVLTVTDNDTPTFTVSDATAEEQGDPLTTRARHIITLSKTIDSDTTIRAQTMPDLPTQTTKPATSGVDFTAVNQLITIPAGSPQGEVFVQATDDLVRELVELETYVMQVTAGAAGHVSMGPGTDNTGVGTITDERGFEQFKSALFQFGGDAISSGCKPGLILPVGEPFVNPQDVQFKVVLSAAHFQAFEFELFTDLSAEGPPNATPNADFAPLGGIRIFPANTREFFFTVRLFDDSVSEDDEFFALRATGGLISSTQRACPQDLNGAEGHVRIGWNIN